MPISDEDKAEISQMIAEASRGANPPPTSRRPARSGSPGSWEPSQDQWDRMPDRDRRSYVREIVEEQLAELDAETERADLRRENEELRKQMAEWEKGGRQGPRPKKGDSERPRAEEVPTLVSKAFTWLFGDPSGASANRR